VYPGTCRARWHDPPSSRGACAQRVRVADTVVTFDDLLQGPQRQDLATDAGDFVVRRADGLFAYQLAVVVDDAALGATTIVRGADLLASTPRQIHLQRLLGLTTPAYLHVPIAVNAAGEKLSKQTGAAALPDEPVPALLAAWRFLDQPMPDAHPVHAAEFIAFAQRAWSRQRLPRAAQRLAPRGW
jgi:glutamyl-Q tRNA(Asp) synthetase